MDYFKLTREFWDFAFENPEKIKPNHCALYLFIVEHCNRLGWKQKFGLPTTMAKDAIGIRSYNTYINTLVDLVDFGFIDMLEKSKNQYSSNIIALSNNDKAVVKALDKAFIKHDTKQSESTIQSIDSINKQDTIYNKPITIYNDVFESEVIEFSFKDFWALYPNKIGKAKAETSFNKVLKKDLEILEYHLNYFVKNPPFKEYSYPHATTYLNQKRYLDEIQINNFNNLQNEQIANYTAEIRNSNPNK